MDDEQRDPTRYESVPREAVHLFRMSWQLELWLREITYVEVRASHPDWQDFLKRVIKRWPTEAVSNDKKLTHMATAHESELSYLTFGQLCELIMSNWDLWSDYFPPLENFRSKIAEVRTIRNRVAHCRRPHTNDERRLDLFLRDLDPGIRRFCLRYCEPGRADKADPVATEIARLWSEYGWATELRSNDIGWLYALGESQRDPRLGVGLTRVCRPDMSTGTIYRLEMRGIRGHELDIHHPLQWIAALDREPIHAIIVSDNELTVTLPAALGTDRVTDIALQLIDVAKNGAGRSTLKAAAAVDWPEWILFPNHPLAIFDPDYPPGPILDLG
jgi:hypothetical protein